MDETNCKYVCSRGILKQCDIHSSQPISGVRNLIGYDLTKFSEGMTIYVSSAALEDFIRNFHKINGKFILVTGDCDIEVPTDIFNSWFEFNYFMEHPNIIHWFTQNCSVKHPKMTAIPIGLDYHTMTTSSHWGAQASPVEQEAQLIQIQSRLKPFYERQMKCYSNFHFAMHMRFAEERRRAIREISEDLVFYEPEFKMRELSWNNQGEYAFVLSPSGNGKDCHRTWEALCLGCIPIVKSSGIDSVFDELPVWIVNDWKEVNMENMKNKIEEFKDKTFDYRRLSMEYWCNRIKNIKGGC